MTMPPGPDSGAAPLRGWPGAAALWAELAPQPGRFEASVRMLVACLLVVATSMTLQLPDAALSAYMVFFISREDMATTRSTAIALVFAISLAIALSLLLDIVTFDNPPLRVALMTLLFCAGMYLSRVFIAGPLGFGLGFILLVTQSSTDLYRVPETLVRDTLWNWVAICFSIAAVVLVNHLVLPARPRQLLLREARRALALVVGVLDAQLAELDGRAPLATPGPARLLSLLTLAASDDARLRQRLPAYDAMVRALNHLLESAALLQRRGVPVSPALRPRLLELRDTCLRLDQALTGADGAAPPYPAAGRLAAAAMPDDPLLEEMARHVRRIVALYAAADAPPPAPPPSARRPLLLADAFSNPVYLQFALKTGAATIFCYIVYTALDWPGIHTCVITCAVTALTSNGAAIHKGTLRVAGALTGGALALLATVFIIPSLDSLGGLLLLIAPVVALSAWISAGSERAAYFGWQLAFAFFLCVLHGLQANTDVTLVRDRLLGIVFGIVVMAVVFGRVWPERARDSVYATLARAARATAALLEAGGMAPDDVVERRGAVLRDLAAADKLAGLSPFEGGDDAALLGAVRAALMAALALPPAGAGGNDRRPLAALLTRAAQRMAMDTDDGRWPADAELDDRINVELNGGINAGLNLELDAGAGGDALVVARALLEMLEDRRPA